ncbi:cation diffusion facilitator family transporter [Olsenella phocaeensis]|uniref:cation diffusion facilitator family transporter n=1 Tax=Olsenella phocaeensis TaxID=1852385 RepID=UPI0009FA239B|nr:cation diffusion facilitator family transporter [Olsenella phocaeensis]
MSGEQVDSEGGQELRTLLERDEGERDRIIVRASELAIAGNVVLAAFKAVVGALTGSIAIALDAVNNLSDALSSLITIIGTRLASRPADRRHPFGYGRVEYLSAIVIAAIVLAAGASSLKESVASILDPATPDYSATSLAIVAAAVVAKLLMGRHARSVGRRVSSDALVASGTDASMDAAISATTLAAAFVHLATGARLEGWLGALISVIIFKSGVSMLRETLSKVLGERVDAGVSRRVKEAVESVDGVRGAYDLLLSDYGPQRLQGSVHVEVDDRLAAPQIDALSRAIQSRAFERCGVILTTVGIYATNDSGSEALRDLREGVERIVWSHEHVAQMHGFYANEERHTALFDVIVDFDDPDRMGTYEAIRAECSEAYPDWSFTVGLDSDVSD